MLKNKHAHFIHKQIFNGISQKCCFESSHQDICAKVNASVCVWLPVGARNRAAPTGSGGGAKEARGAGKATQGGDQHQAETY